MLEGCVAKGGEHLKRQGGSSRPTNVCECGSRKCKQSSCHRQLDTWFQDEHLRTGHIAKNLTNSRTSNNTVTIVVHPRMYKIVLPRRPRTTRNNCKQVYEKCSYTCQTTKAHTFAVDGGVYTQEPIVCDEERTHGPTVGALNAESPQRIFSKFSKK